MHEELQTSWTVVWTAAAGDHDACSTLVQDYLGVVRAYLRHRWASSDLRVDIDDAVQEVFFDLFRHDGALQRLDPERGTSFRAFLFGVVRNVGRRYEDRLSRRGSLDVDGAVDPDEVESEDPTLSRAFDRAWALCLMRRAAQRQRAVAEAEGPAALRRVELLQLRFRDGLQIREIARLWREDAAHLHREYAKARAEFKRALAAELRFHQAPAGGIDSASIDKHCRQLIGLLG